MHESGDLVTSYYFSSSLCHLCQRILRVCVLNDQLPERKREMQAREKEKEDKWKEKERGKEGQGEERN